MLLQRLAAWRVVGVRSLHRSAVACSDNKPRRPQRHPGHGQGHGQGANTRGQPSNQPHQRGGGKPNNTRRADGKTAVFAYPRPGPVATPSAVEEATADNRAALDGLLQKSDALLTDYAKLQLFTFLHGRNNVPALDNINAAELEKQLKSELDYLVPSQLKLDNPHPPVRKPLFEELPADHPARNPLHRPASPAHFTGRAAFYDLLSDLEALEAKLPTLSLEEAANQKQLNRLVSHEVTWLKQEELSFSISLPLKTSEYRQVIAKLNAMWASPQRSLVEQDLRQFMRTKNRSTTQTSDQSKDKLQLDEQGRAYATGRRKSSVARVWVQRGTGRVTVNGTSLAEYFPKMSDRVHALEPLNHLGQAAKFDVDCTSSGGGSSGQSGAIRLGVSRALRAFDDSYHVLLRQGGFLTRDARVVERKKPGQKKARKKFQWVKR